MVRPYDMINRQDEFIPDTTLRGEIFPADRRQPVEPPAALASFFHPAACDQISVFQPAENGIERADAKIDAPFGTGFDQLTNFITMARPRFDQGENQEFRTAFFKLAIEHIAPQYTLVKNMSNQRDHQRRATKIGMY
jgi:hypothetical protein